MSMTRSTRRDLRRILAYLVIAPAIIVTFVAFQHIQSDPLAPLTWLLTLAAAALLVTFVRCIDSANR